jgi:DNA-binding GntR family transcriptional regulator
MRDVPKLCVAGQGQHCQTRVVRELSAAATVLADRLRDELLSGEWSPGSRLKEEHLAQRFHVGRYTVRSALRTLVTNGLLEHEPNRGARVPELYPERVDQLFAYRTVLEVGSLRIALSRGLALEPVAGATAALENLPADAPWPQVLRTHQEIHRTIVALSGNPRLIDAYTGCEEELQFVTAITRPAYTAGKLAALHIELLAHLLHGGDRAVDALTRDIEIGRGAVLDAMTATVTATG